MPGVTQVAYRRLSHTFHRHLLPWLGTVPPLEAAAYRVYSRAKDRFPGRERDLADLPNPLVSHGLRLWHDGRRSYTAYSIARGWHELATTSLVLRTLKPGSRFLDLGAHIGWYTLLAARAVGDTGHVWAFEPDPANFALLQRNLQENGLAAAVTALPAAVTNAVGEATLTTYKEDSGSASLAERPLTTSAHYSVPTTSLDAWAEAADWPEVDLVKIDVEGAELDVLAGMRELVRRLPHLRLIMELYRETLDASGTRPEQLFDALEAMGFTRVAVIDKRLQVIRSRRQRQRIIRRARWLPVNLLAMRG